MSEEKENNKYVFNGSIQTLLRIDELIKHIAAYKVNDHIIGYRENLHELFIESQGFLTKSELDKAKKDWVKISEFIVTVNKDQTITFASDLKLKLDSFYTWLRLKLHKKDITFSKRGSDYSGYDNMKGKYGLSD